MIDSVVLERARETLKKANERPCWSGPLSHLMEVLVIDTNKSIAAYVPSSSCDTRSDALLESPTGRSELGAAGGVTAAALEQDLRYLRRAISRSQRFCKNDIGVQSGGRQSSGRHLPYPEERGSLRRTEDRLDACCRRVEEFLAWLGVETLSPFPTILSPYTTLRHLLLSEYEFGMCLHNTPEAWSTVVPMWIPKLEQECTDVEASFQKWGWTDRAHVTFDGWRVCAVLQGCTRMLRELGRSPLESVEDDEAIHGPAGCLLQRMRVFCRLWNQPAASTEAVQQSLSVIANVLQGKSIPTIEYSVGVTPTTVTPTTPNLATNYRSPEEREKEKAESLWRNSEAKFMQEEPEVREGRDEAQREVQAYYEEHPKSSLQEACEARRWAENRKYDKDYWDGLFVSGD
jgi:hypothetical protein